MSDLPGKLEALVEEAVARVRLSGATGLSRGADDGARALANLARAYRDVVEAEIMLCDPAARDALGSRESEGKDLAPLPKFLREGSLVPLPESSCRCPVCKSDRDWGVDASLTAAKLRPEHDKDLALASARTKCTRCGHEGTVRDAVIALYCEKHGIPLPPRIAEARRALRELGGA